MLWHNIGFEGQLFAMLRNIVFVLLVVATFGYKSVKDVKPLLEDDAMEHHHLHRAHRRGVKGVKLEEADHIDVLHQKHLKESGEPHRVKSPHPKHHVGPRYSDIVLPSHKPTPRFDNQGNPIPHEISDGTHHNLRHK